MSTHSESIQALTAVIGMVGVVVEMQQHTRGKVGEIMDTLNHVVGDTSIGAQLDQYQAAIAQDCDGAIDKLVRFGEMLQGMLAQMQQMGGM